MARVSNIRDDLKRLSGQFKKVGKALRGQALANGALEMALVVKRGVQAEAPVDTGDYRAAIREYAGASSPESATAEVSVNKPQALALEFGSGLHAEKGPKEKYPIQPDTAEVLAFVWPNAPAGVGPPGPDGKYRFPAVMHPGIEAQPHFRPGYQKTKASAIKAGKAVLERELKKGLK